MGKREKKLSPEEEEQRRLEEQEAVQQAYLGIYKDARSRRNKPFDGGFGIGGSVGSFPIPPQPHRTVILGDPVAEATKTASFSAKQKEAIISSMRKTRSGGLCARKGLASSFVMTDLGTMSSLTNGFKSYAEAIIEIWNDKDGGPLDELVTNLTFPIPKTDAKVLIAELANHMADLYSDSVGGMGLLEIIVISLYTMDAPDIDRFLTFTDAPPPYRADFQSVRDTWSTYTPRNASLRESILDICQQLYSDPSCPSVRQVASKWIKVIGILMGLTDGLQVTKCFKGLMSPIEEITSLSKGSFFGLVAPTEASVSHAVGDMFAGMGDQPSENSVFIISTKEGLLTSGVSQYPDEEELMLPLCSILKVTNVTPSTSESTPSMIHCEVVSSSSMNESVQLFRSQAIAEARIAGEWLAQLAIAVRGEADDSRDKQHSDDDSSVSSGDDGEFLTPTELKSLDNLSSSKYKGSCPNRWTPEFRPSESPTEQSCTNLCLKLREEYLSKKGDVIDELISNLRSPHPRGSAEHKREALQRLSIMGKLMYEKVKSQFPDLHVVDVVMMWLYTAHGTNIDSLMGFTVPPYPDDNTTPDYNEKNKQWKQYCSDHHTEDHNSENRTRNGAIFGDINWALRQEGSNGEKNPKAAMLIRKWCKYTTALMATLSAKQKTAQRIFRGFGGQSGDAFNHFMKIAPGSTIMWPAFSSCAIDREVAISYIDGTAANSTITIGKAFIFHIDNATFGMPMSAISAYPAETEHTLPMAELVVTDSFSDEELTTRYQTAVRDALTNADEKADELVAEVEAGVVCLSLKTFYGSCCIKDVIYLAERDSKRTSRRILRVSKSVYAMEHPSNLTRSRAELVDSAEDLDYEPLFLLANSPRVPFIIKEVVEALRYILDPEGRECAVVEDTLDTLAHNKGPKALSDRILNWTIDCTKKDDLPDETGVKRRLHSFCSTKRTKYVVC